MRAQTRLTLVLVAGTLPLLPQTATAQTPVPPLRGVVVDTSGAPVPQADVIAIGHTRQTEGPHYARTDEGGRFVFPRLLPGTYTVTVRRIGFVPIQAPVTLVEDTPRNVRFEMHRMPQVLTDVVVEVPRTAADSAARNLPLFRGIVIDSAGREIPQVEIVAAGSTLRIRGPHTRLTNFRGEFAFENFQPGGYFVTVRRIGYVPIRVALTFESRTPRTIRFELQPMPQQLADVAVTADGFDLDRISKRVSAGAYRGTLLTRDDLERMAPRALGDAIGKTLTAVRPETFDEPNLGFSHLWIRPGNDPFRLIAAEQRGRDCPPWISVNGERIRPGWAVNDFNPEHIEAIEIYKGPQYPFPFDADPNLVGGMLPRNRLSRDPSAALCGQLVIIWLRPGLVVAPPE